MKRIDKETNPYANPWRYGHVDGCWGREANSSQFASFAAQREYLAGYLQGVEDMTKLYKEIA